MPSHLLARSDGLARIPQHHLNVRGVELGLEEEGVVPLLRMDREEEVRDLGTAQFIDKGGLLFGVKAVVLVDAENQILMIGLARATEEFVGILRLSLDHGIVAAPHLADAEVGVRIETIGKLFSLMEHVALDVVMGLIPRESIPRLDYVLAGAALDRIEVDKSLVTDHPGESEPGFGSPALVILARLEARIILDRENLLEQDDAVQDRRFHPGGERHDEPDPLRVEGREGHATKHAGRGPYDSEELPDPERIEEQGLTADDVIHRDVGKGGAVAFPRRGIEAGRSGRAVAAAHVVGANDEILIRIEGFARSDEEIPPAFLTFPRPELVAFYPRIVARSMLATGESVEKQDGIGPGFIQLSVGLVGKFDVVETGSTTEHEGLLRCRDGLELGFNLSDFTHQIRGRQG